MIVILMTLMLAAVAPGDGSDGGLPPRAAFFSPPSRTAVALSPDGAWVGWLVEGEPRLVVRRTDPGSPERALDLPARAREWRFAHREAVVIAVVGAPGGDRLLVCDLADDQPAWRTIEVAEPSQGLRLEALSAERPGELLIRMDEVRRVSLDGSPAEVGPTEGDTTPWAGASAFDRVHYDSRFGPVAATRRSTDATVSAFVRGDAGWVSIAEWGWLDNRVCGVLGVSADGESVWLADNTGRDRGALVRHDPSTLEWEVVLEDPDADLVPAGATFDPLTGELEAVVAYWDRMRRHLLDDSLSATFDALARHVPGDVSYVARGADSRRWLVRSMAGGPLEYWLYDRQEDSAERLFGVVDALQDVALATRVPSLVTTRDGLRIPAHVYLPPGSDTDRDGRPDEPLPTVFYVHGGPWIGMEWNSWFTNRSFQLLASRGLAVVRVDFRGAGGYGRAWMARGDHEFGGRMTDDVLDATRWAVDQGIADAERLALWGWSYGGYTVFQALAREPGLYACGLSMYGLSDVLEFASDLVRDGVGENWRLQVGDPATDAGCATLRAHSPLFAAERITAPLLVTHGGADTVAPISHSDRMVARLAELDRPVTYLVYPDEGHDYRAAESWISWWAVAERFLARHLGSASTALGDDLSEARFEVKHGAERIPGLTEAL